MSNFSTIIRESLERQVTPTTTLADLYSQLSRATGIDQERVQHLVNGVITELSEEQVASIAKVIGVPAQRLQQIYANDRAYLSFVGIYTKETKGGDLSNLIADLVQRRLDAILKPILQRMDEIEDRALQRVRFDREPALAQATQEKSISTGVPVPAFQFLTDAMYGRTKAHQTPTVAPLEPSRTHIEPPAFASLKRQLGALSV